jgi:hypothetical protein
VRGVLRPKRLYRIGRQRRRQRHLGQRPAIRSPELKRPIGQSLDLVALFVNCAVMAMAEYDEVLQRRRAALRPVPHVMPLAEPDVPAREAAALVPMVQRPP